MAPFGSGHTVLDGNSTPDSPKGATMPRNGVNAAIVAVLLVAAGCGGDEDRAPADPVEDAGPDRAVSDVEPTGDASPDTLAAPAADRSEEATADATPVRLGDRFRWCARVQALWDAEDRARAQVEATAAAHLAAVDVLEAATDDLDRAEAQQAMERALGDHGRARRTYGHARATAAGLFFSDRSNPLIGDLDDETLQVALERALDAFRASAGADTLAVFDLAREATETVQQPRTAADFDAEQSNQPVDAADAGSAPLDASEAWIKATEAFEDAIEAAEDAAAADDAVKAAVMASQGAVGDAKGAAWAIVESTLDGEWEAMTADIEAHLAAALSAVGAAENYQQQAFEARTAASAAAATALAAAEASAAARAVAEQSGATEGSQAYWDASARVPVPQRNAEFSARGAASSAGTTTRSLASAARAAEGAAWNAARFFASVDTRGVAAVKQSLQQSCQ